jgi:hypothetical protein
MALTSGSEFLFQVSAKDILPAIGTGFDLINGQAMAVSGFEASNDFDTQPRNSHNSKFFAIYDASSMEDAANFDMETSGGGWGASVGMTFSASARVKTTARSYTVHFNGASTSTQATVKPSTPLSASAANVLTSGIAEFIERYGSHFVAGYIYGRTCKLSYNMQFDSIAAQVAFTATYAESVSELGFNESTKASLSNALTTSNTRSTTDVESNCRGYETVSPSNFDDLTKAMEAFDAASNSETPVAIIVMPWFFLDAVNSQVGLERNKVETLAPLLNKWIYISNTCQRFIADGLYAGKTQLDAVRAVMNRATDAQTSLLSILTEANQKGSTLTVDQASDGLIVNNTKFTYAETMIDDMNFAMRNFVLGFTVFGTDLPLYDAGRRGLGGNRYVFEPASLDGKEGSVLEASNGSYFQWQQAPEGPWNEVAMLRSEGQISLGLDADTGNVQWRYLVPGNVNVFSDPTTIRGKATRSCNDPQNEDRIQFQFGSLTLTVSPM